LSKRKKQIDDDWQMIYHVRFGIIHDISEMLLQKPMPRETLIEIRNLLADFCKPFLKVCKDALPIHAGMSAKQLNHTLLVNVQVRLDNGMIQNNKADSVRHLRERLETLLEDVKRSYEQHLRPESYSAVSLSGVQLGPAPVVNSQHKRRTTYAAADALTNAQAASTKQATNVAKMRITKVPSYTGDGGARPPWLGPPKMQSVFTPGAGRPSRGSDSGAAARARLYAGAATSAATMSYPVADDHEMDVDEYEDMPALEPEESWHERERNKRYDQLLAKSRRESEALDIPIKRDIVDGFFDYNPHITTSAMEQDRYAQEVARHNSMIKRSEEAIQRMHFFGNHAYNDWRDMDACLQNVTEMPQMDQRNRGFF